MSERFNFEAFAEAQGVDFREYLSMIAAKLPKVDENSRAIQERRSEERRVGKEC